MTFIRAIWRQLRLEYQVALTIVGLEVGLVLSSFLEKLFKYWDSGDADLFFRIHGMERVAIFVGVSLLLIDLLGPKIVRLVWKTVILVRRLLR